MICLDGFLYWRYQFVELVQHYQLKKMKKLTVEQFQYYSAVQQETIKMIFVFNVIFLTIGAHKCYILYTKMITSFYWTV